MYLTFHLLTDVNNIITGLNSLTLRKVNVKPYGSDKMYIDKNLIEYKLYQLIGQFNERRLNHRVFNLYYLIRYIHFLVVMRELVRCYLLAISIRCYNFNKISSIVNKGGKNSIKVVSNLLRIGRN